MAEIYEVINLSQANREGCQCVMSGGVRGTRDIRKGAFVGIGGRKIPLCYVPTFPNASQRCHQQL
jgi:hypothetical protein